MKKIGRYELVRELVTATGEVGTSPAVAWYRSVRDSKEQMQDVAQIFMGIRMQCAQCHHHPYEKWSQADYAQLSAFFTTVSKKNDRDTNEPGFFARVGGAAARHPKTGQSLKPAGLDAGEAEIAATDDPRAQPGRAMCIHHSTGVMALGCALSGLRTVDRVRRSIGHR